MPRKFKPFPAAGPQPTGMHALASLGVPGCSQSSGCPARLGVGQPAWKRLQEAFPGLALFTRQRWEGGRVGSGRAGSEASCLSS